MPKRRPHSESYPAKAEYNDIGAGRDFGGIHHRANARRHAATYVATLLERRIVTNFSHRDLRQHGEIGECRAAHVVEDRLAVVAEARCTVGHQSLALGRTNCGA
jgi:hypothetical protein